MTPSEQDELAYWKAWALRLASEVKALQAAHAVLKHREWFTIQGGQLPPFRGAWGSLYVLEGETYRPFVSLHRRDVLLIGKYTEEPEREAVVAAFAALGDGA